MRQVGLDVGRAGMTDDEIVIINTHPFNGTIIDFLSRVFRLTITQVVVNRSCPRAVLLIVQPSDLRFIDSAGIAVLIATAAQVPLVEVRNPSAILRRILETSGLTIVLRISP